MPVTLPPPQPQPAAGFEQSGHDYPRGPPSHRSSSFPASETGPRQQDGTKPDQKQKLLSLFGKPQAAALGPEEKGKGKEPRDECPVRQDPSWRQWASTHPARLSGPVHCGGRRG